MSLAEKLGDYFVGTWRSANGAFYAVPSALFSILQAKFSLGIGPRYHSLYNLSKKPTAERKAYLLEEANIVVLKKINPLSVQKITHNKLEFDRHLRAHGIPTIPTLAIIATPSVNSEDGIPNGWVLSNWQEIASTLPAQLFFKLINGAHGAEAFCSIRRDGKWVLGTKMASTEELHSYCIERIGKGAGWIIQPLINPHADLIPVMASGALGTLRVTTYLAADGPRIMLPLLKLTTKGNSTDNFSQGTTGNMVAAVDMETGCLSPGRRSRFNVRPHIESVDVHPDTGHQISGLKVPHWPEVKELLLRAQAVTPEPRTMGWDIAITDEGPVVVEANSIYSTDIIQVAYDRGIKREFEDMVTALR